VRFVCTEVSEEVPAASMKGFTAATERRKLFYRGGLIGVCTIERGGLIGV
jgi:hypothetical protein